MSATIIIDQQITIAATQKAVFAYACDYRNDPHWRSGVHQMSSNSDSNGSNGRTQVGDRTQEVMRVLGRTTRTEAIITAHEPNSHTAFRTIAGDLTAHGHRQTRPAGDATVFAYHAEAVLDRPLRPIAKLIERLFNRRAAKDLRSLAELLEKLGPPPLAEHRLASGSDRRCVDRATE